MRIAGQQQARTTAAEIETVETDEAGRTVHVMPQRGAGPGPSRVAPSASMNELWAQGDKIDKVVWLQLYTAIIGAEMSSPDTECDFAQCAAAADLAYFEYHLKQNPRQRSR